MQSDPKAYTINILSLLIRSLMTRLMEGKNTAWFAHLNNKSASHQYAISNLNRKQFLPKKNDEKPFQYACPNNPLIVQKHSCSIRELSHWSRYFTMDAQSTTFSHVEPIRNC
jgi:hypothetical protein